MTYVIYFRRYKFKLVLFTDLEAPTPTPNRDPMVAHFTFDLHPQHNHLHHNQGHHTAVPMGNFENPEYYDTDSTGSDKDDQNHRRRPNNKHPASTKSRQQAKDYYNEVNGLYSDGGSTRGSTAESTSSM